MYVRPLLRQKPWPGRFTFGGVESPPNPPLYSTDEGGLGEVKLVKCPQVCKLFVRCLCGDVVNLCLRSIVPCRK